MHETEKILWPGWETVKMIGRGSFGAVYEIRRDVLGEEEKAALKVISIPQNANDIEEMYNDGYDEESITATFKEHLKGIVAEYSLMRKLSDCVNVVNCGDVRYVEQANGIGWDVFIKMELLTPLTKALPDAIPEQTVIKLAKDMCAALIECKKHNVIHRDIKPQNIFVSGNGDYKLGDFGVAKTLERTSGGTKIGTYKYMAPEVYNNQPYGISADIYSLGLVLYWMLNNRRMPFLPSASQTVTASMEEDARMRRFSGEALPTPERGSQALKAVVLKACAFQPTDRYKTPEQMLDALNAIGVENSTRKPAGGAAGSSSGAAKDLDVKAVAFVAKATAEAGCIHELKIDGVGKLKIKVPAGTQNGAMLRLAGAGKVNPATGARGDAYITVQYIDEVFADFFGGKKNTGGVKETAAVITTGEARNGCKKIIALPNGNNKTLQIPAGCKDGQLVDGIRVYVHDFNRKEKNLEKLPDAVLAMYANKSSGLGGGIIFAFILWMIFGMVTMQIPVMAVGLVGHIVIAVMVSVKKKQVIDEAARILQLRQGKNSQKKQ